MAKARLKKLPLQKKSDAEAMRLKNKEVIAKALELKKELGKKRSLEVSAMVILFRPLRRDAKIAKADKRLDLGEISANMMEGIASLKRFVDSHPEMEPHILRGQKVYMFPYGLPLEGNKNPAKK
ncbi:MAG: hypothetical protein ACRDF4_00180 [Rhabdochlamydiaceae bacterium]